MWIFTDIEHNASLLDFCQSLTGHLFISYLLICERKEEDTQVRGMEAGV